MKLPPAVTALVVIAEPEPLAAVSMVSAVAAPALTVTRLEVPVIVPVTVSVPVTLREPAVFKVTPLEKLCTPASPATKV